MRVCQVHFSSVQSEAEKLQRLKERVETQEAKLRKIRAMRGQVDYSKLINGTLCKSEHGAEVKWYQSKREPNSKGCLWYADVLEGP